MKKILLVSFVLFSACNKKSDFDINKEYTVEGYLYQRVGGQPFKDKRISLSQTEMAYSHGDPTVRTDSVGHFKFTYKLLKQDASLFIYPVLSDYNCIYSDISYIGNLQSGKDLNVGKIYVLQ